MGIYILSHTESALKQITTYPDMDNPVLEAVIGDESFWIQEDNIVSYVRELISTSMVDQILAEHIAADYSQLFEGQEFIFPLNDEIFTPFCFFSLEDNNADTSLDRAITDIAITDLAMEKSIDNLEDFAFRQERDRLNNEFFTLGKSQSYGLFAQKTFAPGTSNEKQITTENKIETHKIEEVLCTFSKNQNKILLSLECDACDRESIEISAQDKDKILFCQSLACLISALKGIKGGEWVANSIEALIPSVNDEEPNNLRFN